MFDGWGWARFASAAVLLLWHALVRYNESSEKFTLLQDCIVPSRDKDEVRRVKQNNERDGHGFRDKRAGAPEPLQHGLGRELKQEVCGNRGRPEQPTRMAGAGGSGPKHPELKSYNAGQGEHREHGRGDAEPDELG